MSKHTPGPWTSVNWGSKNKIVAGGMCVATTGMQQTGEQSSHDASLIAAAPEMYEALVWILQYIQSPDSFKAPAIEKVRAAIRKAEGTEDK